MHGKKASSLTLASFKLRNVSWCSSVSNTTSLPTFWINVNAAAKCFNFSDPTRASKCTVLWPLLLLLLLLLLAIIRSVLRASS